MSAPTRKVRETIYSRDGARCVSCGSAGPLEAQHRRAVGMGGRKVRPEPHELLTACSLCNERFESDLQEKALLAGWKVRRFCPVSDALVPVWFPWSRAWFRLNRDGTRDPLSESVAREWRGMAGILPEQIAERRMK